MNRLIILSQTLLHLQFPLVQPRFKLLYIAHQLLHLFVKLDEQPFRHFIAHRLQVNVERPLIFNSLLDLGLDFSAQLGDHGVQL